MSFDYKSMQTMAANLLSSAEFGNPFILKKKGGTVYDKSTKKNVTTYTDYSGVGVSRAYSVEQIGALANIIKAGDLQFICQMDDESIIPVENNDRVIYGDVTYNLLDVKTLNPNGSKIMIHYLHLRRAST